MESLLVPATCLAALGSGLIAGVFFAFSSFILRALAQVPPERGMQAMQQINVTVLNPLFLGIFVGTALLCLPLAVYAGMHWRSPGMQWLLAGCVLYTAGCFLVTMVLNVPLNDALAAADPTTQAGIDLWARYLRDWSLWNSVRTAASLAASAAFIVASLRFS
jgi:uncharacterized membrane protein